MSTTSALRVLLIVGSVRVERRADAILDWWLRATERTRAALDMHLEVADLRQLALPLDDEPGEPQAGDYVSASTRAWSAMVERADAMVVLTGEHNHSMPAALKNAFDHLSAEWGGKPVAWLSYGNTSAGTRGLLAAKQVATTLGMVSVGPDVSLRIADLAADGTPAEPWRGDAARAAVVALARWGSALRGLRRDLVLVPDLPSGLDASAAEPSDAAELLVLQRACWVDEARANDTLAITALDEPIEAVEAAIRERTVLVVRHGTRVVASVRAWAEGDVWHIGRLMVAPDQRHRGIAGAMLRHAESLRPPTSTRVRLSTGERSVDNIRLYASHGYAQSAAGDGVVTLEKRAATPSASTIPSGRG